MTKRALRLRWLRLKRHLRSCGTSELAIRRAARGYLCRFPARAVA
jgi:hypothetical protein